MPDFSDDAGFTIVAAITATMATAEGKNFVGIVEASAILFKLKQVVCCGDRISIIRKLKNQFIIEFLLK